MRLARLYSLALYVLPCVLLCICDLLSYRSFIIKYLRMRSSLKQSALLAILAQMYASA
jgi:hypothetical protein